MTGGGIVLTEEFERALDLLESGSHLFLTGKAGTGKSTLIRHFMAETDRNVVVVAPTGIAALNVDGYTLHRLFGFGTTTHLDEVRHGRYYPAAFAGALKAMDTLIIDEASMVRADVFDMFAAALERFGPRPGTPFGGVQIVLVGDLYQLPPVVREGDETRFFSTRYQTPFFFSADSFDRDAFPTVALTTVFRQLGDQRLTSILNAIREGVLVEQADKELNSRVAPDFVPPEDEFWLTLAPTNSIVTARNRQRLERLPGAEHAFAARTSGDLSTFDAPAEAVVRFKVGAQVMMLTNDGLDRWVNGTIGRIVGVDETEGTVVSVEFRDGTTARFGPYTWEVTRPVVEDRTLRKEVVGTFTQLPFKLAWAITIHKSQGQTLDRLVVDLSGGAFASGQVYVALSRCTSMEGLVLKRPVFPRDLKTDRRIMRFLRETTSDTTARRYCAVATLDVGGVGRMWRPRPVEIAVAFDDGTAISTLVNPRSDLYGARDAYDISVADVLLAPTLAEAWSVLGPALDGWTPVGVDVDVTLEHVDFELKRLGVTAPLPVGISLPTAGLRPEERAGLDGRTALSRARAMLAARDRLGVVDPGAGPFADYDGTAESARYLLTRDAGVPTPRPAQLPGLAGLMQVSRELGGVVLGGATAASVRAADPDLVPLRRLVGEGLRSVIERVAPLPPELASRVGEVDALLGTDISGTLASLASGLPDIDAVLVPGAMVCFTGTAHSPAGVPIERDELRAIVSEHGLIPVDSVSKRRCDVLIAAEAGTQSGKARKAMDYGKPVFSVDDFWAWLGRRPA